MRTGFVVLQIIYDNVWRQQKSRRTYILFHFLIPVVDQMLYSEADIKPQLQHIPVPTSFSPPPGSLSPASAITDDETDGDSLPESPEMMSYIGRWKWCWWPGSKILKNELG